MTLRIFVSKRTGGVRTVLEFAQESTWSSGFTCIGQEILAIGRKHGPRTAAGLT